MNYSDSHFQMISLCGFGFFLKWRIERKIKGGEIEGKGG